MAARRRQPFQAPGLRGLERPSPDDNVPMRATGKVFFDPKFGDWYVEYSHPTTQERLVMWRRDTQAIVEGTRKSPLPPRRR